MSFQIDDEELLEKYIAILNKIEDLENTELNVNIELLIYDERYIKTKIRTYHDKVYTECESFKVISIDSLLVYNNKYFLQVYLQNCG